MLTTFRQSSTPRSTTAPTASNLFWMTRYYPLVSCFCCDDRQALSRHLVSSSLHGIIKDLQPIFAASNRGLTPALVQVTVKVALTLKFVRCGGLPADAARQKHRAKE